MQIYHGHCRSATQPIPSGIEFCHRHFRAVSSDGQRQSTRLCTTAGPDTAIPRQYRVSRCCHENTSSPFGNQGSAYRAVDTAGLPIRCTVGRRWGVIITRPAFKSEAILGFLSPNYRGHVTWFFRKTSKWHCLASLKMLPRKSVFQFFCQSFDDWAQ